MIRFCDKDISIIELKEIDCCNTEEFFESYRQGVIIVCDAGFYGYITYSWFRAAKNVYEAIQREHIYFCDDFWNACRKKLRGRKNEILPLLDERNEQVLGFVYDDTTNEEMLKLLYKLYAYEDVESVFKMMYPGIEQFYILGCNEAAFILEKSLERTSIVVTLIGDMWERLGLKTMQRFHERMEKYSFYLCAEGNGYHWEHAKKMSVSRSNDVSYVKHDFGGVVSGRIVKGEKLSVFYWR